MIKRIILLIMVAVMSFSLAACGYTQKVNTIVNLKNVSSITVTLYPPNETITLTDEQVEELLNMLNGMSVGKKDESFRELNGQWVQFDIIKEDGSAVSIGEHGGYLSLDNVGYKCIQKESEMLNDFANALLARR